MRLGTALVVLCGLAATASSDSSVPPREYSSFLLPPGYVEDPAASGSALEEFRANKPATISGDLTLFRSPDRKVSLVRMRWVFWEGAELSRAALEKVDQDLEAGIADEMFPGVTRITMSRRFVDDQLIAHSTDELGDAQFRMRRVYGLDAFGFVHLFAIVCAGPTEQLGYCDRTQRTMKLTVPHQLALSALPKHGERPRAPPAWGMGHTIGTALLVALVVGLGSWIFASVRRRDRRRRRR
jgi:hypothetical protein